MNEPSARSAHIAVLIAVLVHALFWLPVFGELYFFIPWSLKAFANYQVKLPAATEAVLAHTRFCSDFPFVLPAVVLLMLVIDGFVYRWLRQKVNSPILSEIWYAMMIGFPLIAWLYCGLAMRLASIKLVEALSR
jgi:hypothetical protein